MEKFKVSAKSKCTSTRLALAFRISYDGINSFFSAINKIRTRIFKMSRPEEIFKNLQKMATQAGRGGPSPRGMAGGAASIAILLGVVVAGNSALFNVDGGHRAIKYTRIGGVSKEIYSEGTFCCSVEALYSDQHVPLQARISGSHGSRPQ